MWPDPPRPGEPLGLDHLDEDRARYAGPEHRASNRATAADRVERVRTQEPGGRGEAREAPTGGASLAWRAFPFGFHRDVCHGEEVERFKNAQEN